MTRSDRRSPVVWMGAVALLALLAGVAALVWWRAGSAQHGTSGAEGDDASESDDTSEEQDDSATGSGTPAGSRRPPRRARGGPGGSNATGHVRDASAASGNANAIDEDGGAASFARRRAAFIVAVNEMLAALPARRFEGAEPDIGWQRGFGHALRVNNAPLRLCWEQSEARLGDRGGMMAYELEVAPNGDVSDAAITADPVGDAAFTACLLGVLRGMSFSPSAGPVSMQAGLLVGGARYRGARPARAAGHPDDGLTFVHALRGIGPMPE